MNASSLSNKYRFETIERIRIEEYGNLMRYNGWKIIKIEDSRYHPECVIVTCEKVCGLIPHEKVNQRNH